MRLVVVAAHAHPCSKARLQRKLVKEMGRSFNRNNEDLVDQEKSLGESPSTETLLATECKGKPINFSPSIIIPEFSQILYLVEHFYNYQLK